MTAGAPERSETAWLDLIGMGAAGPASLGSAALERLRGAEVVFGSERLLALCTGLAADIFPWPRPFDALLDRLEEFRGRPVVVLATGDPLWFSVGARIAAAFGPKDLRIHPHLSSFQLAAARLRWSLAHIDLVTAHGRPVEQVLPLVAPGARLLVLAGGAETPRALGRLLADRGYGDSVMTALAQLGGPGEMQVSRLAAGWAVEVPDLHVLAVECVADPDAQVLPRTPGLADDVFAHDGQITKREIRALTVAKLMPQRGALLWDVGAGCGSVSVEWMRAAPDAQAIAVEPREDRRALIVDNAAALGVPRLEIVAGRAPEALDGLPPPDAVFLGGGLTHEIADMAVSVLKPLGRLVANVVTLEGEQVLAEAQAALGGELTRLAVARAGPLGQGRGWQPFRPVTQWSLLKR